MKNSINQIKVKTELMAIGLSNFPFIDQSSDSPNCGPYSLFMVANYLGISILPHELVSKCNTNKKWGTSTIDLRRAAINIGIDIQRIKITEIESRLRRKIPILVCIKFNEKEYHWCVIKGYTKNAYIFSDSLFGPDVIRYKEETIPRLMELYACQKSN